MTTVAPTATIDPKAQIAGDVEIGPGCYVGPKVHIGPGCRLIANVTIIGNTEIGGNNTFYPTAVIGAAPQDLKYKGSPTRLVIGDNNVFREVVTVHPGTENGGGLTAIGNDNQFQVGTHIAHDVMVGDNCILSNQVQVAGHVHIEDHVNIAGLAGVQQFVTIGRYAFVTGMARCQSDIPPFLIFGFDGSIQGVNVKGLSRWGFPEQSVQHLRDMCKRLFPKRHQPAAYYGLRNLYGLFGPRRNGQAEIATMARRIRDAQTYGPLDENCQYLLDFVKRSIHQGVHGRYLESLRRDHNGQPPEFYKRERQPEATR